MRDLLLDLRFARRSLARRPLYALTVAATLGLGLAAASVVFSLIDHLLLRPVPGVSEPGRVVEIGRSFQGRGFDSLAWPEVSDLAGLDAFSEVAAVRYATVSVRQPEAGAGTGAGTAAPSAVADTRRRPSMVVSPDYFPILGLKPTAGRFFAAGEGDPGDPRLVTVVSHRLWHREFGGDPAVVGRAIRINRRQFTIVGVAPAGFHGHEALRRPDLYLPTGALAVVDPALHGELAAAGTAGAFDSRRFNWLQVVARLAPGWSVDRADAATRGLFAALGQEHPEVYRQKSARVLPLRAAPGFTRRAASAFLAVLLALSGVLVAVTCANVSGLFLARNADRRRELAVRLAVGSGRGRLVRQLLLELCLLFALGALLAFGLATAAARALAAWLPTLGPLDLPPLDLAPDLRVFAFALAVALVAGLATGTLPALRASRPRLVPALKAGVEGGLAGGHGAEGRLRRLFVSLQIALTLLLLVTAGLLVRSLQASGRAELTFQPRGVATAALDLASEGYEEDAGRDLGLRFLERAGGLAGVDSVALALDLPLDLSSNGTSAFPEAVAAGEGAGNAGAGDDAVEVDAAASLGVEFNMVTPGYFSALRLPVVAGRAFSDSDRAGGPQVAVVSRAFVEAAWPGTSPSRALGRRFRHGAEDAPWSTVVGVAEDVANQTFSESVDPMVYLPWAQHYRPEVRLVVRAAASGTPETGAAGSDAGIATAARAAATTRAAVDELRRLDPDLAVGPIQGLPEVTDVSRTPQRVAAGLATGLGLVALLLASMGIYGLVAFAAVRRRREVGIRMALGAEPGEILRGILRRELTAVLPALAVGAGLALLAARGLRGLLYGVGPADPLVLAGSITLILAVIATAALVPARRSAATDPAEALRGS